MSTHLFQIGDIVRINESANKLYGPLSKKTDQDTD